jgi:uncharacterized protein YutE (UPF0331/DUF86 family)
MAKFRNLLVHRYAEVDPAELHDIIDNDLHDLTDFIRQIDDWQDRDTEHDL